MTTYRDKILVVDDNETVRDLLSIRLESKGFQVFTAVDGREALENMRQDSFDLVLLDIMMPEVNGYDVLEAMQADEELRQLPVIVLSALNDMNSVVKCVSLGAEDYLFKPINTALLWARLDTTLEKKHLRDLEKARLAELSVLQRIDRELNTALDVARASQITLNSAMNQLGAAAGLIGILQEGRLQVQAVNGVNETAVSPVKLSSLTADALLLDSTPQQKSIPPGTGFHPQSTNRVLVPIRRNSTLHGLISLEHTDSFTGDQLGFLARLSSHAAIALTNAQLFAAVEAANQAKSAFVSVVAHELKAPMTVISAYIDLLPTVDSVTEKQQEFLDVMRLSIDRMVTMASDLSDISRIEMGKLKLHRKNLALPEIIYEIAEAWRQQFAKKEQTLHLKLAENLPQVFADRNRLVQIITNLVSNASKYTPAQGTITIHARLAENGNPSIVELAVEDTGLGISKEEHDSIFNQFFRSRDEEVRLELGTGLGLNITKQLVELHGGKIWFESEYRRGTTFTFSIPAAARG